MRLHDFDLDRYLFDFAGAEWIKILNRRLARCRLALEQAKRFGSREDGERIFAEYAALLRERQSIEEQRRGR